ncbi:MAG: S-adenosyl-L-homocysteine hydrolase [Sphingorhabdus sp.]
MRGIFKQAALVVAIALASTQPAQACWTNAGQDAVKIKHLNTMLMVTALRCRGGADNFLPQYNRFVTNNSALIGTQNNLIKSHLAQTVGQKGAVNALDKMSIGFANSYGTGHSRMNCHELKQLASDLASQRHGVATLVAAADKVVDDTRLPGGVCATRMATRP